MPRREERDRQRAEDDARRAAETAEREARKKEDAERGVAIAASLAAMCDDMEQLARRKDGRAIDRVLQQAAKAFEQIGKVAAGERDALADRYSAARGKLVVRASELREAEDWERFQNVPKAEALIATAKEMARGAGDAGSRQPAAPAPGAVEGSRPDAAAPLEGAVGAVQGDAAIRSTRRSRACARSRARSSPRSRRSRRR